MSVFELLFIIVPATLVYAAPLIVTAIGGVFSEKSGVVNIGLEGLMVVGAFTSVVFNLEFGATFGNATPWLGLFMAMLVAGVFSQLHALASITFRAEQVVSGVALNMLALGGAVFLVKLLYDKGQTEQIQYAFNTKNSIPVLSRIPYIGKIFFQELPWTSLLAILIAVVAWFVLYKTSFGLRLRAVGEHPMAADTMGIHVERMRYLAVFISGLLGGLGGAIYAETVTHEFNYATIAGQGFIAMAAMIFGKWHPLGALGAALFFGFAQILSHSSANLPFVQNFPDVVLFILPYFLTLLALAGFIGRADAPAASGIPYIKGNR